MFSTAIRIFFNPRFEPRFERSDSVVERELAATGNNSSFRFARILDRDSISLAQGRWSRRARWSVDTIRDLADRETDRWMDVIPRGDNYSYPPGWTFNWAGSGVISVNIDQDRTGRETRDG